MSAPRLTGPPGRTWSEASEDEIFNIIPIHSLHNHHPSFQCQEVLAAMAALRTVDNLRKPTTDQGHPFMDLLDWLALLFGFQKDNVKNQREHLVLHLANAQMRLSTPSDTIDAALIRKFRLKLLKNYTSWCSFLNVDPNICLPDKSNNNLQRELLYVSLYLLIWGESANLRLMPECICYIFHHIAMEMNKIIGNYIDEETGQTVKTSFSGENAFLNSVVMPIYETIRAEVQSSKNGTAPHSSWRNYDDLNEYFWTKRCFEKLKWPIDVKSDYFLNPNQQKHVAKTGFVEHRSFWNLFRSFYRLWVMLILVLQAAIIFAWEERTYSLEAMHDRNVQVRVFTVFLTWSMLRFWQSLLDVLMQYSLVSMETMWVGVKMVLKCVISAAWMSVLGVFYWRIWAQKNIDGQWSTESDKKMMHFLEASLVFVLPELLGFVFYMFPSVGNLLETKNWWIFSWLSWLFQDRIFVGRGLNEALVDKIKYTVFWVLILATKFTFSYFLQITPMIKPSKQLLDLRDLSNGSHKTWNDGNWFAVVLLWLPVVLIYLMDLQVWYSIFSSLAGAFVGCLAHLGEIRNIHQLRLRFQFFASAVQFNLVPEEQKPSRRGTLKNKFKDAIHWWYGFGRQQKRLETDQIKANKFAVIWNEIVTTFREEDIISDQEVELLELPQNSWNVSVIRWPCFVLCDQLLIALGLAKQLADAPGGRVWYKICKNEYRRCAVIEVYESVKHLLLTIIKFNTEEHSIIKVLFQEIDHSLQIGEFTKTFNMSALLGFHVKLIKLVELLKEIEKDIYQVVITVQDLYEIAVLDFFKEKRTTAQLKEDGLAIRDPATMAGLLFENAVELPDASDRTFYRQIRRLHTIITCRDSMNKVPRNAEARRRLTFFGNSLFMNMPHAPPVKKMMAFSVLTPYHKDKVLYSGKSLETKNEDGVSILYYLQTVYDDEWKNFIERMRREGMVDCNEIWTSKLMDLRLWASYRGQTLARTVRGMMYYHRALEMLEFVDSVAGTDASKCSTEFESMKRGAGFGSSVEDSKYGAALIKYTYVVSYAEFRAQTGMEEPHAENISYLMENNDALRVAYVDVVKTGRDENEYYSVLAKYDQKLKREVEIYRIKLPGHFKLGEGKPENQNHAIIFTRGDALQTIDMNQDNYFEEALKMRNVLEEFRYKHGIRKPAILGIREHIFTGQVSTLAWFMSAQETSFVTLAQRVMANPLKIRMHYGHPDVFDRFWFLTRGGISKASKVININEDIFAGFNCTLRGGSVTHIEYTQVGKGRDLGFSHLSKFEAKIASGNGEQVLSRDVYRLGNRLDFFRMLSFFCSSVGFYFNSMIVILTVYALLWGWLYFALSGIEASAMANNVGDKKAVETIMNQQLIVQLGLFTLLPYMIETSLENGFLRSLSEFVMMQLQFSPIFYTFSLGTKLHFFGRTILHGGAKYQSTGRDFDVQHTSFAANYRLYARSHVVKAIELGLILTVYDLYTSTARETFFYIDLTISSWLLVLSWILSPFLFNPSGFDWLRTVHDFYDFTNWVWYTGGCLMVKPEQSWERWWSDEQDHFRTTGLLGKLLETVLNFRFFYFQYGIVYKLSIAEGNTSFAVYLLSWVYVVVAFGFYSAIAYANSKYAARQHIYFRFIKLLVFTSAGLIIVALLQFTSFRIGDLFISLLAFVPTGWGIISIAQVFGPILKHTAVWSWVISLARLYDLMFGMIVMAPVAFLSWIPGFQHMQARMLFNPAFCRGLRIFQIMSAEKSKM